MCGISGIYNFDSEKQVDKDLLHKMNDSLKHRGPDDEGIYVGGRVSGVGCRTSGVGGRVGLAHRRLSIIDLSPQGRQPMCNEDSSIWIVFNNAVW